MNDRKFTHLLLVDAVLPTSLDVLDRIELEGRTGRVKSAVSAFEPLTLPSEGEIK